MTSNSSDSTERSRVISPIELREPSGKFESADLGALLMRLVLFDENILDSTYLREMPFLVQAMGADRAAQLLEECGVRLLVDPRVLGEHAARDASPLSASVFRFLVGWNIPPRRWFAQALEDFESSFVFQSAAERSRFITTLVDRAVYLPDNYGEASLLQLESDLDQLPPPLYRSALSLALAANGITVGDDQLRFDVARFDDTGFVVRTNLEDLGLDGRTGVGIARSALFALGDLHFRVERMMSLDAVSGFEPDELPLFDVKLSTITRSPSPEDQFESLLRVVEVNGLPDLGALLESGRRLNVDRLVDLRESDEIKAFRRWLRTVTSPSQAEVDDAVAGVVNRLRLFLGTPLGRVFRFTVATATGFVPQVGLPLGVTIGALDGFLVDRLTVPQGPLTLVSKQYASLFERV